MEKLHYKYGLGDKVRLVKRPSSPYARTTHSYFSDGLPNKVYEINGWGWTQDKDGEYKQYYRLHAYCDDYLDYHNRITEKELEPVDDVHPFDDEELVYKSIDGEILKIGMSCYDSIYFGDYKKPYMNNAMMFVSYGEIICISKFQEAGYNYVNRDVTIRRDVEFDYHTQSIRNRDGYKHSEIAFYLMVRATDAFAENYVNSILKHKDSKILTEESHRDYNRVHVWLEHMGILDRVMEFYKARKSGKKLPSEKKTQKTSKPKTKKEKVDLVAMVENLSAADKKKFKQLLLEE